MGLSNANGLWGLVQGLWGGATTLWSGDSGLSGGGSTLGFDVLLENGAFVLMEDGVTFVELENGPGPGPKFLQTDAGINLQTDAGVQISTSS